MRQTFELILHRKNKWLFFSLILFCLASTVCSSFYPLSLGYIVDNFDSLGTQDLLICGLIFFISIVLILTFDFFTKLFRAKLKMMVLTEVRETCLANLLQLPFSEFHRRSFDWYSSFLTNDVDEFYSRYLENLIYAAPKAFTLTALFSIMFWQNWILGLIILLVSFLTCLLPPLTGKRFDRKQSKVIEGKADYLKCANELMQSHDLVQSNNFSRLSNLHKRRLMRRQYLEFGFDRYEAKVQVMGGATLYIVQAVVFIAGLALIFTDHSTVGEFSASLLFTDLIAAQVSDLIYDFYACKGGKAYAIKVLRYYSAPSFSSDRECPEDFHAIELVDPVFEIAPSRELSGQSFSINKGDKVAIIGANGAGKTTFLRLLCGFERCTRGKILLDGVPIDSLDLSSLLSIVPQTSFLFEGTIRENISMFSSFWDCTADCWLKTLGIYDRADENVGRDGCLLSGGERAKVCLLRALYQKKQILIMDEPFASIDRETEAELQRFLLEQDITLLEVTHNRNESILSGFNCIINIEDGNISTPISPDVYFKIRKDSD